jgi:predicted DCC family thiol-disulfide oxidoreductase YuxK
MDSYHNKKIIYFDGVCNLCNGFVQFVINRDHKNALLFASLQSTAGIEMMQHFQLSNDITTVIFVDNGVLYKKSTAALHIVKHLKGIWPLAFAFIVVPTFIRDAVYDFIAKNRYRWFGKKEECMVPTLALKSRFIS